VSRKTRRRLATLSSPGTGRRPSHKISREDILAHAYAQCRSNKGAPGIDGQDFADIEAYGVERWLAELALALREETYRPEPIRRVLIPKANGKLRPLGISTVRDRVCMTAAMLRPTKPMNFPASWENAGNFVNFALSNPSKVIKKRSLINLVRSLIPGASEQGIFCRRAGN